MKAIAGTKYLYIRKEWFYFRIKLPKRLGVREIKLSLNTKSLSYALVKLQRLSSQIQQLKQLVVSTKSVETSGIISLLSMIKETMLKQLNIDDIDGVIAECEQHYSHNAHMLNVLGSKHIADNDFLEELAYFLQGEDYDDRVRRFREIGRGLDEENKKLFTEAAFSMVRFMFGEFEPSYTNKTGVNQIARNILSIKNFIVDESSLAFKIFVNKLTASHELQAKLTSNIIKGDAVAERKLQQLLHTVSKETPPSVNVDDVAIQPLFSEVYKDFLEHKVSKEHLSIKMQKDYARKYTVWEVLMEDKPIDQYKAKDIGQFIDACFELPKMHCVPYSKMSWEQRLSCEVPEDDRQSPKSVHQYYKWLQGVFAYAKRDTIGYIETSPCSIKRNFTTNTRGIFNDIELKKLIKAADKEQTKWKKWIIYLAIYTGARLGELAQLRVNDFKLDAETGRYYLLITDNHGSQKLKTENAKRKIPIHHDLIDAGFIEHVKTCKERVFDELTSPKPVTGWFPRQRDALDIEYLNELDHMRTFHSFRHTFITKLMNVESMNINLLQQVVGHEISKFGVTSNYTHKLDSLKNLLPVVDAFKV